MNSFAYIEGLFVDDFSRDEIENALVGLCREVKIRRVSRVRGYERIREACRKGGYPEPEWQEMGMCTRVIFRPHPNVVASEPVNAPVNVPVNERQRWFMEHLQRGGQVKAEDIVSQWQVSLATAKRDIASLREKELIEFVGAAKTGSYRLKASGESS